MNYSDKVLEFARNAHDGQYRKYGSNLPYIYHPVAVAGIAVDKMKEELGSKWNTRGNEYLEEYVKSIAYLHDVLEDTKVTELELLNFLQPIAYSHGLTLAENIVDAVAILTKSKENFDLFRYLDSIKKNYITKCVKLSDLEHNMSDLKDKKKLDYYRLVKYYLQHN